MKDFLARLSSRKFLVTVGGIIACTLYPEQASNIVTLIVTFIGAEGAADVVGRYATQKTEQAKVEQKTNLMQSGVIDPDPVDKNTVLPGNAAAQDIGL